MKQITLKNLEWRPDNTYYDPAGTRNWYGVTRNVNKIVIHWWNTPEAAGTFDQTIDYLLRPSTIESIHFVVSGDRVAQCVNMANTAFHAKSANPTSVGIEIDPRTPGNTYETVGALVRFIRSYYGNIPIQPHSKYVATSCPGSIDLDKIDDYAYGRIKDQPLPPEPKPTEPPKQRPEPAPRITYKELAPTDFVTNKQPTSLWNFNASKWSGFEEVESYRRGHPVQVAGVAHHPIGADYLMTAYSFGKADETGEPNNPWGFNRVDLTPLPPAPKPKPQPEPEPPAPAPQPEPTAHDREQQTMNIERALVIVILAGLALLVLSSVL